VKGLAQLACNTDRIDARVLAGLRQRDLVPARFKLGRRDAGISQVDRDIVAHLLERIREARAGETPIPLTDIADQLRARVETL